MPDPVKKADLRAEITRLREELAAEKARAETLRETHHCGGCSCAHPVWVYPYPTYPQTIWTAPYVVTTGSGTTTNASTTGAALARELNSLARTADVSYTN